MMLLDKRSIWIACLFIAAAMLVSGCGKETGTPQVTQPALPTSTPTLPPTETPTPTPTPTPVPLAVIINDEAITLAEFQAEVARYQASQAASGQDGSGTNLATDGEQVVLDELVSQVLLAQAARQAGFLVDQAGIQVRMDELAAQIGGQQALAEWINAHGYSDQEFERAMIRSVEAAWMRDQVTATIPDTAEQVYARQILLYNSDQADQVYKLLQTGRDFATLASEYDPLAGGDIGWFPRGYLAELSLEEAAFSLEPGQYSQVIETRLGFHILQVIEKDPQHPLDPDARWVLQVLALQDWLQVQRSQSEIQVLLPK